ncbi:hypothetical protein MSG28_000366 [Choristoneura fumiferana]|uniref:Uncharacterized protein n=1 Tax=Choristoneura fumiferana TaxID=7141 RepID=A0ACC0K0C2_CHOFU|nr:hypothetical protein MSG28_000366 [Choristoneura fumiferana]
MAQMFNTLQATFAIMMPTSLSQLMESYTSIRRLEFYLLLDEREDLRSVPDVDIAKLVQSVENKRNNLSEVDLRPNTFKKIDNEGIFNPGFVHNEKSVAPPALAPQSISPDVGVLIQDVSASWTEDGPITLRNLNISVPKGKLCAIIGSVGSGKSSVLQLLLNELRSTSGRIHLSGPLSYACQEPWLFVATVRQNILFGLPYNSKKYKEVVRVCALQKDFQQFPHGDQTLVGERGASLSGGQRARINLARAVYRQADVYLLDDPLSAVDAHVGRQLFDECINGYLRHATRVLVTHQLHYLKAADYIVIMNNGSVEAKGTYSELLNYGKDFAKLLSASQENDEKEEEKPKPMSRRTSARLSTARRPSLTESTTGAEVPAQEMEEEERESGSMGWHVYNAYLRAGGKTPRLLFMVLLLVIGQLSATLCDYWVTFWTNEVTRQKERETNSTIKDYDRNLLTPTNSSFNLGSYFSGIELQPDLNINAYIGPLDTSQYLYVYTALIICCIFFITARAYMFFKVCMTSSRNLHNDMFHSMLRGVMRFFDNNSSGRILNRFSKDIGALDELLPRFLLECIQIYLVMFSILALNAAALVWTLLPTTIILLLFYTILQIYLKSAQSIKRLEGTKTIFSGNVGLAISQTLILTGMLQFGVRQTAEVGIVGRTGAGKSSLISSLFRLAIVEGEVLIDDVDTSQLALQVDLKSAIQSLDFKVSEGGSNFSLGQRQLVTDEFIQRTIRKRFADCTVLTVAHRLNTIMDSDRVMVMDAGRLVEFDHPYKLLINPEGYFTKMVKETSDKMSEQLFQIAKTTFLNSGGVIE